MTDDEYAAWMRANKPDQPDGIDEQSHETPDSQRAADRVRLWIEQFGDGLCAVDGGQPLYSRDLFALVKAANSLVASQCAHRLSVSEHDRTHTELLATRKAKQENDERFQLERDQARIERDEVTELNRDASEKLQAVFRLHNGMTCLDSEGEDSETGTWTCATLRAMGAVSMFIPADTSIAEAKQPVEGEDLS